MDIKSWFPKPEAVVLGHGLVQAFAKSLPIRGFIHGLDKPIA
jgi:hypothetical protein